MPTHLQVPGSVRGLAMCGIFRHPFPFGVEYDILNTTCVPCLDSLKVLHG